jgi:hypothetical protein
MFCSWLLFFGGDLKVGESFGPHLVEVRAETGDTLGVELVEATRAGAGVEDQACIFEDLEVLGDSGTADGESASELVHG